MLDIKSTISPSTDLDRYLSSREIRLAELEPLIKFQFESQLRSTITESAVLSLVDFSSNNMGGKKMGDTLRRNSSIALPPFPKITADLGIPQQGTLKHLLDWAGATTALREAHRSNGLSTDLVVERKKTKEIAVGKEKCAAGYVVNEQIITTGFVLRVPESARIHVLDPSPLGALACQAAIAFTQDLARAICAFDLLKETGHSIKLENVFSRMAQLLPLDQLTNSDRKVTLAELAQVAKKRPVLNGEIESLVYRALKEENHVKFFERAQQRVTTLDAEDEKRAQEVEAERQRQLNRSALPTLEEVAIARKAIIQGYIGESTVGAKLDDKAQKQLAKSLFKLWNGTAKDWEAVFEAIDNGSDSEEIISNMRARRTYSVLNQTKASVPKTPEPAVAAIDKIQALLKVEVASTAESHIAEQLQTLRPLQRKAYERTIPKMSLGLFPHSKNLGVKSKRPQDEVVIQPMWEVKIDTADGPLRIYYVPKFRDKFVLIANVGTKDDQDEDVQNARIFARAALK